MLQMQKTIHRLIGLGLSYNESRSSEALEFFEKQVRLFGIEEMCVPVVDNGGETRMVHMLGLPWLFLTKEFREPEHQEFLDRFIIAVTPQGLR